MADFEQGLPDPRPAFRVVMGGPEGLMVGTYPVSPDRAYYFVCRPVPEARPPSRALLLRRSRARLLRGCWALPLRGFRALLL